MTKNSKKLILIISITLAVIIITIIAVVLFPRSFPKPNTSGDVYDIIVAEYTYSSNGGFITNIYDNHPSADEVYSAIKEYRYHLTFEKPFLGAERELRITGPKAGDAITIFSNGVVGVNNGWYKLYGGESAANTIINDIISLVE